MFVFFFILHDTCYQICYTNKLVCRCDVRDYQASERENRRKSVALRLDSWREQKLATEKMRNQQLLEQEEDAYFKELEAEALRNAREAMKNSEKMDLLLGKFAF